MRIHVIALLLLFFLSVRAQEIQLVEVGRGFSLPVDISHAGDERLFITEKAGLIRILWPDGSKPALPFLDIKARVNSAANERGLLGLTFHPRYRENGYFFVNYTNSSGHSTISRFSVTSDPNLADANSEKVILVVNQPFNNHNAGDLAFGPDGYLYVGFGDGGSGGDPGNRSQNPQNLLGKMLRIDIDTEAPYEIPDDNPWVGNQDTMPEIWAFGLRNPWRYSFDRQTGDLWIGDVGQNKWEEINYTPRGIPAINYGWRCYEGAETFNTAGCRDASFYTPPVFAYRNPTLGCSVTGGFVYRGTEASRYQGKYIFADYCSGRFWSVQKNSNDAFEGVEIARFTANQYVTFGENAKGSLFVAGIGNGIIYAVKDSKCSYLDTLDFIDVMPVSCHDSCDAQIILQPIGSISSYEWSNGSNILLQENLCPGLYSVTVTDTIGCVKSYDFTIDSVLPLAAYLVKQGDTLIASSNEQTVQFQWYKDGEILQGETGQTLKSQGNGSFYVVITNASGCVAISNVVEVFDCTYLVSVSSLNATQASCHDTCDGSISLETSAQILSYSWDSGQFGNNIDSLCPGTYTLTIVDVNNCIAILQATLDTVEELTVELNIAGQFFGAFANQAVSYQWFRNGEAIPGATNQTYEANTSGEFYVVVTNENGCTAQSISITITGTIDEVDAGPSIRCKTISGEGILFLFNQDVEADVLVIDVLGRIIHKESGRFTANQWNKIIVGGHSDGYYYMRVSMGKRQYTYKVFLKF